MKKVFLLLFALLFVGFLGIVVAENDDSRDEAVKAFEDRVREGLPSQEMMKERDFEGNRTGLRNITRFEERDFENESEDSVKRREFGAQIREIEKEEFRMDKIKISDKIKFIRGNDSESNWTLRANLSNGRMALFKIMPETASARAIARLGLKMCNESNNCTITLKEVGQGNSTKAVYEVKAKKEHSFLWIFKWKKDVKTEIDAETD